ncbi:MAG TPA: hypothetical protein VMQ38_15365 [Mycobacterium sp.]|jgi:hypothetical protein|nr:hypothetical protein [Mycobacterium sp.]
MHALAGHRRRRVRAVVRRAGRLRDITGDAGPGGILYSILYAAASAPSIDDGAGRVADFLDLAVPPGSMRWTAIEYAPGAEFSMHHTDTFDFDVVLSGSVELIFDDGATR